MVPPASSVPTVMPRTICPRSPVQINAPLKPVILATDGSEACEVVRQCCLVSTHPRSLFAPVGGLILPESAAMTTAADSRQQSQKPGFRPRRLPAPVNAWRQGRPRRRANVCFHAAPPTSRCPTVRAQRTPAAQSALLSSSSARRSFSPSSNSPRMWRSINCSQSLFFVHCAAPQAGFYARTYLLLESKQRLPHGLDGHSEPLADLLITQFVGEPRSQHALAALRHPFQTTFATPHAKTLLRPVA